ncbi:MAG TPA: VOC family protein [Chloroflexota bacterium]|nr:VOC family protein [Chloroflexota bacterium]
MKTYVRNIVFACPHPPALGSFYAELLGLKVIRTDWFVVAADERSFPRLAFGDGPAVYRPPGWPDPAHPQQLHLDFPAHDLEAAGERALRLGATLLQDRGDTYTYADPAGHPFCLYRDTTDREPSGPPLSGRIGRIVYDCFSPRALAAFYQELLGMRTRKQDSERCVVIAGDDGDRPMLAFQHAPQLIPPRWPDPAYPQQLHLDLHVEDARTAGELALRLGAIRLPAMGGSCPVYADPSAHPFCLCAPGD